MKRICTVAVALMAVMVLRLSATTREPVELKCPLDGKTVRGWQIMSTNTFGGCDSDFCGYAMGDQPRKYAAATCPQCLYSGLNKDFKVEYTEDEKARLRQALTKWQSGIEPEKRERVPPWERYEIAAACIAALRKEVDMDIAELYMLAAWCLRDEIVGPVLAEMNPGQHDKTAFQRIQQALAQRQFTSKSEQATLSAFMWWELQAEDFEKRLSAGDRSELQTAVIKSIRWRHRLGDSARVDELFTIMEEKTVPKLSEEVRAFKELVQKERHYLKKAADAMQKELERVGQADKGQGVLLYRLGEFHRRTGNKEQAVGFYKSALGQKDVRPDIVPVAEFQLARLGDTFRLSSEERKSAKKARLKTLTAELVDPERSGYAAGSLGDIIALEGIPDAETIADIVKATTHENKDVRWFAVGVLRGIPDPKSHEALKKVLADDPDDGPKWGAIDALIWVGDFSCVPPIVAFLKSKAGRLHPDQDRHHVMWAAKALERFTNRDIPRPEYFADVKLYEELVRDWIEAWEQNAQLSEERWIQAGFAHAGCVFRDIYAPQSVPTLIAVMKKKPWPCGFHANEILKRITGENFDQAGGEEARWLHWEIGDYCMPPAQAVIAAWEKWLTHREQKK